MTSGQRFCTECGAPLVPDTRFCGKCGNPVAGQMPAGTPPTTQAPIPQQVPIT